MAEKTFDARLGDRARSMLVPLIAAADGILDAGNYGATWKEGDPDLAVFLGSVGAGFVSLMPRDQTVAAWLHDRYGTKDGSTPVLLFSCTNGWIMATIPVYRQIILDAATDNKLILASPDFDGLVNELVPEEHRHHHSPLDDRLDRAVDRITSAIERAAEKIEKAGRIKSAEERWPDLRERLLSPENARILEKAGETQELMERALGAIIEVEEDGFIGAVPEDTSGLTTNDAHLHAYVCMENGLVYLHAREKDDWLAIPFLAEILSIAADGEEPEGHAILEAGPSGMQAPSGRLVFGITNLPYVEALAKCLGILVWRGYDCSPDEHADHSDN